MGIVSEMMKEDCDILARIDEVFPVDTHIARLVVAFFALGMGANHQAVIDGVRDRLFSHSDTLLDAAIAHFDPPEGVSDLYLGVVMQAYFIQQILIAAIKQPNAKLLMVTQLSEKVMRSRSRAMPKDAKALSDIKVHI